MGWTSVKLCETEKEWDDLREVFVRAFMNYPLFQYIAPNGSTRGEFLHRYLNAHYEIHVKNGNSLLIAIHVAKAQEDSKASQKNQAMTEQGSIHSPQAGSEETRIIGGVLFVPPAKDGVGWEFVTDDAYVQSYNHMKLKEVDEEAFERLKSYEKWETKHVSSKIMNLKIPVWNGLFCAIDPAHSGSGCGSMNYKDCMRVMSEAHSSLQDQCQQTRSQLRPIAIPEVEDEFRHHSAYQIPKPCAVSSKFQENDCSSDFQMKLLRGLSFITHHPHVSPRRTSKKTDPIELYPMNSQSPNSGVLETEGNTSHLPLVLAVSHSRRAVQFHEKNGFHCVKEVPFTPNGEKDSPLSAFVLFSDVFCTGRLGEVRSKLAQQKSEKHGVNVIKCLESNFSNELEHTTGIA